MSRRESRASMGAARQNDALFEFESFKKKFLLANKHITKLNSTLSVRIEELNAQISTLYVENLRLRASEIALTAQLKREREKSRKVMADAEAASQNLTKHLTYLRETYNIKHMVDTPPTPPSPRARRPVLNANPSPTSPHFNRIARPPNIPGIYEDEEPSLSSSEENPKQTTPPRRKPKSKPRLSASKLPLPARGPSPTPSGPQLPGSCNVEPSINSTASKRKAARRQSGLLTVNTQALSVPRSGSPAFGSPIRLEAGRAEVEEELAAVHGELEVEILEPGVEETLVKKEKRKGKAKDQRESESEKDGMVEAVARSREKKRLREEDDSEGAKFKQKDVSTHRTALQPIDNNVHEHSEPDTQLAPTSNRQFIRPASPSNSLPRSHGSSSPAPANSSETDGAIGGRERRTRKSVNYAEPKLNTKMRKPEPPPGSSDPPRPKKRSSAAAVMSTTTYKPPEAMDVGNEADVDTEARSSLEVAPALPPPPLSGLVPASVAPLLLRGANGDYINPELFPLPASRPGSAAAMYSPGPPSRTTGSTTSSSSSISTTATAAASSSSSSSVSQSIKRQKSRPQLILSDSDSDGADADAEYVGGKGSSGSGSGSGSWVNVEGRRKALPKRNAAVVAVTAIEDIRRHSLAY